MKYENGPKNRVDDGGASHCSEASKLYNRYALLILTLIAGINYLDRQILGILLPEIKKEFVLNNWQLGILSGPAFGLVYATMTIPIAMVADRRSRRAVIGCSVFFFSIMTVLCGMATQFWQLCLARFGVGIGEAGTLPATNSLLADLFPPEKRSSAFAFYTSGTNMGLLVGFLGGGLLAELYGWRYAFILAGVPGLVLAALVMTTVKEPIRGRQGPSDVVSEDAPTVLDVIRYLWARSEIRWLISGMAFASLSVFSSLAFVPLFLTEVHELSTIQIGLALAVVTGIVGFACTWTSGLLADVLSRRTLAHSLLVPMGVTLIAAPFGLVFFLSDNTYLALAAGIVPMAVTFAFAGPVLALFQALVPVQMRARTAAVVISSTHLFGFGLGPPIVGIVSDLLRPSVGHYGLGIGLSLTSVSNLIAAYCFWHGYRLMRDRQ